MQQLRTHIIKHSISCKSILAVALFVSEGVVFWITYNILGDIQHFLDCC